MAKLSKKSIKISSCESSLTISWPGRYIFLTCVAKYQEELVWLSRPDTILIKMVSWIIHLYIYLLYCNHIWGSTYKTNLNYFVILQNKALHIISHMKPRCSTEPLYKELYVMKFDNINTYLIGNFMYCHSKEKYPELFYSFFIKNRDIHVHDTRSAQHFHIPCVITDLGKTGIRYRGAVIWNLIVRDGTNTDVSEAVLKKMLEKG